MEGGADGGGWTEERKGKGFQRRNRGHDFGIGATEDEAAGDLRF